MRCLALAEAAKRAGHWAGFVTTDADEGIAQCIVSADFPIFRVPAIAHLSDPVGPPHNHWLSAPWETDAEVTARAIAETAPDWLIWDHYGLDARWVRKACATVSDMRVMVIDDLDDRPLGAHLLLDQSRIAHRRRKHPALAKLTGPNYALLRPEFASARPAALARRGGFVERVLVAPGLTDPARLAVRALEALAYIPNVSVAVALGSSAKALDTVRQRINAMPWARLHLDARNMGTLMTEADFCIGGAGMTSWERCALGLPSVIVPVAENQRQLAQDLADSGAAVIIPPKETDNPEGFAAHLRRAFDLAPALSRCAHQLCNGKGTDSVLRALSGRLRPVSIHDAHRLFGWRNQPRIRAVSHTRAPLDWEKHLKWVKAAVRSRNGLHFIYSEEGCDLGYINAVERSSGRWKWSFYIGVPGASKGAGGRMCGAFVTKLFKETSCQILTADVMPDNAASLALHKTFGFKEDTSAKSGVLVFGLSRCQVESILGTD